MKRGRHSLIVLLISIWLSQPALAWYDEGHMAVAYIAYQLLTPSIRGRVQALLMRNPAKDQWLARLAGVPASEQPQMLFMLAATWPDAIKRDSLYTSSGDDLNKPTAGRNIGYSDKFRHLYWHYINQPFSDDGSMLPPVPAVNAQERIQLFRQTLAAPIAGADLEDIKSYDLVWLEHLIGDLHQPLHGTTRVSSFQTTGDLGGLWVGISSCSGCSDLHKVWDGLAGMSHKVTVAAAFAAALPAAAATEASVLDEAQWVNDEVALARQYAYAPPIGPGAGPFTLSTAYLTDARNVARERLALAGARLANILNAELK